MTKSSKEQGVITIAEVGALRISLGLDSGNFTSGLQNINRQITALGSEFRAITSGAGRFDTSLEALRDRSDVLTRTMTAHQARVQELRRQYEESARSTGQNSDETLRLATAYNRAVAAMNSTESQLQRINRQIEEQTNTWLQLQRRMQEVGQSFQAVGEKLKNVGQTLSAAITLPLAALGGTALKSASDFESSGARIQNTLGVTAEEAKKLSDMAREIYNRGFGESFDDIQTALLQTKQNIKNLNAEDLSTVAVQAKVLGDTFEAEVNEVTRAGNNIMKGFGVSSQEAFDLMAHGAQKGLNFSNEMFDNLSEYSTLFGNMGFSAEEYFQLLEKGTEAGVYNLDYVNDVMKEFQIRVKDGSKASADAMAQLSDETNKVWQAFLEGDATVKDVHNAVISELKNMDDQVAANNIGVGLYGTKWEDLEAKAMYALGGINGELGNLDGTMQKMVETQEKTFGQRFQATLRELKTALLPLGEVLLAMAEEWLPKIGVAVENVSTWFSNLSPEGQKLAIAIAGISAVVGPLLIVFGAIASGVGALISAFSAVSGVVAAAGGAMAILTGPVGIAVAVIAGLIAIGVALYKNWDEIKIKAAEIWGSISTVLSAILESISQFFTNTWTSITTGTAAAWASLKEFITATGQAISDGLTAIWSGIKDAALIVWNAIVTGIMAIITPIVAGATVVFESMSNGISKIMEGLKMFFSGIWDVIKNIFLGALLLIIDLVTGDFEKLSSDAQAIWNNLKEAFAQIWEGIKLIFIGYGEAIKSFLYLLWNTITTALTLAWDGIKNYLTTLWGDIKTAATKAWDGLKSSVTLIVSITVNTIKELWQSILDWFITLPERLKQYAIDMFNSMRTGVEETVPQVKASVVEGLEKAWDYIRALPSKALEWGKDILQGLINGISDKMEALKNKVTDVSGVITGKIRDLLGIQSPSTVMQEVGQYVVDGLTLGIENKTPDVGAKMDAIATTIASKGSSFISAAVTIGQQFSEALQANVKAPSYSSGSSGGGGGGGSSNHIDGVGNVHNDGNGNVTVNTKSGSYDTKTGNYTIKDEKTGKTTTGHGSQSDYEKAYDKMHEGGWVSSAFSGLSGLFSNLKTDEVPKILQTGEFVLSRKMINNIAKIGNQTAPSASSSVSNQPSPKIENNYNMNFYSPKALDPYETSRMNRNALRELALQV